MLSTSNLTMRFAGQLLFEDVTVKFETGKHFGLIGANGSGKSTFMKILSGELEASSGQVNLQGDQRMASLKQNQFEFDEYRVIDTVIMGHKKLWKIHQERNQLYSLAQMTEEQGIRAAELEMEYAELDGYSAEAKAGQLLLGVDIPTNLHYEKMSDLAPGLKLRVLLTQVLFSNPDIMLLDEPTNNLDINTIRWLEQTLKKYNGTLIIISHDRHFLNSVCTNIADLDYKNIQLFSGNYDEYMIASTVAKQRAEADRAKKQAKISQLQTFVRRFSANAAKSKQATSRLKQIDKMQLEDLKPSSRRFPYMKLTEDNKLHRLAVEINDLENGYDNNPSIFKNVNFILEAGKKLAVIGSNGIGKTTLLKTIINELESRNGSIKWAEKASVGYFPQDHEDQFEQSMSLIEWLQQWAKPGDDDQALRGVLGRLLFSGDSIKKSVNVLSGGEKVRMLIGKMILQKNNVIVLDEPTNHLDMESIESLNVALEEYPGTVILVSHDRQLVSSIATEILEIKPQGKADYYQGSYEEYLASQEMQSAQS
jgi:ATPase subunit of ABC transporter with duplicated ATPase domains